MGCLLKNFAPLISDYSYCSVRNNDIEVYDRGGRHLGSMNPVTGEMYKPAVKGREIKQ